MARTQAPLKKLVTIAELQFGMYVAELDRPWTETPFKFQGFVLKTREELELLARYCRAVFVDPDRKEMGSPETDTIPPRTAAKVDLAAAATARWNDIATTQE